MRDLSLTEVAGFELNEHDQYLCVTSTGNCFVSYSHMDERSRFYFDDVKNKQVFWANEVRFYRIDKQ